jgi:enamine deaminase RidA (YjgF/YER057c/UK114 family)
MKTMQWLPAAIVLWGCSVSNLLLAEEPAIKYFPAPGKWAGFHPVAVAVDDAALAHTAQLFAIDAEGKLVGGDDLEKQLSQMFSNLEQAVTKAGSSIHEIKKANFYAASPDVAEGLPKLLSRIFNAEIACAVSLVVTPLPVPGALVAMDAIAVMPPPPPGSKGGNPTSIVRHRLKEGEGTDRTGLVTVLPRGDAMYVSGQAEPGDSIHAAAKATFEGLLRTLEHYKLEPRNIVQFKVFLDPMEKAGEVKQALEELMPEGTLPPMVFVQWEAPGTVEIEMIATAAALPVVEGDETVSYLTPPWMDSSPNYCRVVRTHGKQIVYFPGLYAAKPGNGAEQVKSIFEQLGTLAKLSGTDYEHLVKATYYVSDDDASTALNKLRPNYYNPKRPPAASKAPVKNVGRAERSFTMDMIGVVPK